MPLDLSQAAFLARRPVLRRPPVDKGSAALADWLLDLRELGARHAGPALVIALETLKRSDVSPARRYRALRLLKGPLLKTCAGLPKVASDLPQSAPADPAPRSSLPACDLSNAPGMTLEQRLYRLTFLSLLDLLHRMDRRCYLPDEHQVRHRAWVVRNLFRFFGRLLIHSAETGLPMPKGAWRELHDIALYLKARQPFRALDQGADVPSPPVDPAVEYKRVLLLGLAARLGGQAAVHPRLIASLDDWALASRLVDPESRLGRTGVYLVEIAEDIAPRRESARLSAGFPGWVLVPPTDFVNALAGILPAERRRPVPDRAREGRRADRACPRSSMMARMASTVEFSLVPRSRMH